METNNFTLALSKILSVEKPWRIDDIQLLEKNKSVNVNISFEKGSLFKCPECENECPVYDSSFRKIRHLDLFQYYCYLNIKIPRINCKDHGIKTIGKTPLFRSGSHYSYLFENKILRLCAEMSMSAIAREINEPDGNLWRVFKFYINHAVENQIDLSKTRRIAVDETANKRGHNYVTIFTDLDTGHVIYVEEGRLKDTLLGLKITLWEHGGKPENITILSMDMSKSYIAGAKEYFPKANIVFDRFHIKQAVNKAVDLVRRSEVGENEELKKTKYLWLKNPVNLSTTQTASINEFMFLSTLKTTEAYRHKLAFDLIWDIQPLAVESALKEWLKCAYATNITPLMAFVKTVNSHFNGILNALKTKITNAVAEGINSKVQLAKSRARGFRNVENFMNMIYYVGNSFNLSTHTK